MNKNQRNILVIAALLIMLMMTFPPWQGTLPRMSIDHMTPIMGNLGYHFILTPPGMRSELSFINTTLLVVQWTGVILVAGLVYFAAGKRNSSS